jgi:epoxyqueuosine reductase QueG
MQQSMQDTKDRLIEQARLWGADIVAVGDTARLHGIETRPPQLLEGFPRAVSMAVRLADGIMDDVTDGPTELYSSHYGRVNALLDDIAIRVVGFLQSHGGKALPIPASHILCKERFIASISHKAVALSAGMGWQGKSLLLVTPEYGPRVRLVTVLTDLLLPADEPLKNRCASCSACEDACPAGAIKGTNTEYHYERRRDAVDLDACLAKLSEFSKAEHIAPYLCGVCVSSCPWGVKKQKLAEPTDSA